jgi:hypothetical protein
MARIRDRDTKPELVLRSMLHPSASASPSAARKTGPSPANPTSSCPSTARSSSSMAASGTVMKTAPPSACRRHAALGGRSR